MHTVSSQFLSRSAADAAVLRLVSAGFERRDISIRLLDGPPPRPSSGAIELAAGLTTRLGQLQSRLAPSPGGLGAAVGGLAGAILGGLGMPLLFAWLGQGHETHSSHVAVATGAAIACVLGSRLGALVALNLTSPSDSDSDSEPPDRGQHSSARPLVVVVRTVEALSRHAGRILERSGACHVSTDA